MNRARLIAVANCRCDLAVTPDRFRPMIRP